MPRTASPGDSIDRLIHPLVAAALVSLLINDHILKGMGPAWITGKLSDLSGLVLLAAVTLAVANSVRARNSGTDLRAVETVGIVIAIALGFTLVEVTPFGETAYRHGLGFLQWGMSLAPLALLGEPASGPWQVAATSDPSDLLALFVLPPTAIVLHRPRIPRVGPRRDRHRLAVGILAVSCVALVATSPPASAILEQEAPGTVTLDGERPAALYSLTVVISQNAMTPPEADGNVSGRVVLDIPDDDQLDVTVLPQDGVPAAGLDEDVVLFDIESCEHGAVCERTIDVVFEYLNVDERTFDWVVRAELRATPANNPPAGADIEISGVDAGRRVVVHRSREEIEGTIAINADHQSAGVELVVDYQPAPRTIMVIGNGSVVVADDGAQNGNVDLRLTTPSGEDSFDGFDVEQLDLRTQCDLLAACRASFHFDITSSNWWLLSADARRSLRWKFTTFVLAITSSDRDQSPSLQLSSRNLE